MKWEEESYARKDEEGNLVTVEEYERTHQATGFARVMSRNDMKLYAICGVGFMLDAYDLFIINQVTPIWTYEYWGGLPGAKHSKKPTYPLLLRGAVNAAANIGNVIGQIAFGFMGDTFGRKFVYGKELIIAMVGIVMVIALPNNHINTTHNKFWWLFGFRVLQGIGIGGDYPMSAAIVAERSTLRNRGRMLGWIFSNQGWGNLLTSIVTLILLGCFSKPLMEGHYGKLDAVWRLQIGLAIVPCLITLYYRLNMPESNKFKQSQELSAVAASSIASSSSTFENFNNEKDLDIKSSEHSPDTSQHGSGGLNDHTAAIVERHAVEPASDVKYKAFLVYFSEWRHAKVLFGTAFTWFLVDISFYGINLNQSVLLANIGFSKGSTEYHALVINALGNLIIAVAGYVPGYFVTIATIEILGRRWIQIQGFLVTALMFAIIAGDYVHLSTGGKFACFVIAQLFFNFGPNATTFIVPGECFPSRVRGLAHGFSAAVGKLGAILSGVLFNWLSGRIGIAKILWIFFGCNILGALVTWFFVPETKGMDADAVDFAECQERVARIEAEKYATRQ